MEADFDTWKLVAGLGLFLYGMKQLEHALQRLAGRSFKQFLRQQTSRPIKGVLVGALTTAALQSSSVVGLIVLAFIGAGILSLASAIGIVFGANLGTTVTGWLVATLGFKLDIEELAMPIIAIGAIGAVWSNQGSRRFFFSQMAIGFGLLLLGLEFMKTGTSAATELFDPSALRAYPLVVFLVVGLLLTAIIQSSSATIMITLSALYAGVVPLESAAAVAIGADLGTTVTIILGAITGSAAKKRVATAMVLFNVVTNIIAFTLLKPLLYLITQVLGISDPLFSLVAFHSLFNLIGVLIFLPLTGGLSRRLESVFMTDTEELPRYLRGSDIEVPEVAVENLVLETRRLIDQAAALNQLSFGLQPVHSYYHSADDRRDVAVFQAGADHDKAYLAVKQLEGAITEFALGLEEQPLETEESKRLGQVFTAIRDAVHAAKCVRDTHHDLDAFRESLNDSFNAYLRRFRNMARQFYELIDELRDADHSAVRFEKLIELRRKNDELHAEMHANIYDEVTARALGATEISTVLNVNREMYMANQGLLFAIADILLDRQMAEDFRAIPASH